jgi:hypothetical protein
MKITRAGLSLAMAGAVALFTSGAIGATDDASKISEFAGKYRGTASLTQNSVPPASGSAIGNFRASKKKENGTLLIASVLSNGSTPVALQESYNFNGRSFTYTLSAAGSSASGFGRANVSKRKISYFATIPIGSSTATVAGTIRRTSKRLLVTEQLNTGLTNATFVYNLKRRGK